MSMITRNLIIAVVLICSVATSLASASLFNHHQKKTNNRKQHHRSSLFASSSSSSSSGSSAGTTTTAQAPPSGSQNILTVCPSGFCPSLNNNNVSSCTQYPFNNGQCLTLEDNTPVSATCGFMGSCVYGQYFPATNDCSGPVNYNFSSVVSPDSDPADYAPACLSIDAQPDGSDPTWTYFVATPGGTQYRAALACGLQCSGCIALSPPQNFGTCFAFTTGSVRIDGIQNCRQSVANLYAYSCQDDVPAAQLAVGSGFAGACRPTASFDDGISTVSITCNSPLPTTTLPPPITTTAAPTPAPVPNITRIYCQGSPDCKQDCRPFGQPYTSDECHNNVGANASGSFFSTCTTKGIVSIIYNFTDCMDTTGTLYITPRKCYPDGQGNGWQYYCNGMN